jgi:hypothetical protein
MNGQLMNFAVSYGGNPIHTNAAVHDRIVVHQIIVNDGRTVVDLSHLGRRQAAMHVVALAEVMQ